MCKRPFCQSYFWTTLLGAMHVAEGIVRYCPVTALFQETNLFNIEQKKNEDHEANSKGLDFNETVPSNPT
jgi:hypothetical protein